MFTVFTCFQNATTRIPEAQGKEMDETCNKNAPDTGSGALF